MRAMALVVFLSVALAFSHGLAEAAVQRVNLINGIGLIDYSRRQTLPVGSWIKYRVTGSSELGMSDDYVVTILIAGEEHFWGEDCFWVETWTQPADGPPNTIANLMSYAIFDDSLASTNMQLYSRKIITEIDPVDGRAIQNVSKRNTGSIKSRKNPQDALSVQIDTLGRETLTIPKGSFETTKVQMKQGIGTTADVGDSSVRTNVIEARIVYHSPKVPITGIVREDIDNIIERKSWKIGQSDEAAPMKLMEHARGAAEVVDWGTGLTPQLVPEAFRRKLKDARPAATKRAPATTARKKTS